MHRKPGTNDFIKYLASVPEDSAGNLDSLAKISESLNVSIARLREQLEVAKELGMVEIQPRTGMRRLPFRFLPAVRQSLSYAMDLEPQSFQQYADLRNHIESAYWFEAVRALEPDDIRALGELMERAWEKLHGSPIQIPHAEHRELHLAIYRRIDNPFVTGLLEAYWEAYEKVGLNLYADYHYLKEVWNYHQVMVDSIRSEDFETGYKALLEHKDLLHFRPAPAGGEEKAVLPVITTNNNNS